MGPKIPVLDDKPGITSIIRIIFEMVGAIVHTVAGGEERLRYGELTKIIRKITGKSGTGE